MKIRKLEIIGFKSFVDKTVLHFDHDVTGIVGPNGCGKSNVVDAIKWVMGEQSPSRLRGKGMEDVIFNGSESRGPHGFAEVSITFENADGLAPPEYRDYAEITVTRKLDRQGRSDYLINRTPVRLLDITNLFLGTGVGRRAYSIIEQGRIGFIVSSKPEDRRSMIEEAAGITKFKVRKRAAEKKMEQTRANLQRVGDILGELDKSLSSLQRQAQKAERYKKYRDEVRDLELYVASFRYLELIGETRLVRGSLESASAADEGSRLAFRVREAELEAERTDVERHGSAVEKAQTRAYELDNAVRVLEGRLAQLTDRLRNLQEREQLAERELGEIVGQRRTLVEERDQLSTALEDLEKAEAEAASIFEREQNELDRRRGAVAEAELVVTGARGRVAEAEKRQARSEAVLQSFERRRADARQRGERIRSEREQLEARATELRQQHEELAARLEGLRSGKAQTAERKAEIEAELQQLRGIIRERDQQLEKLREKVTSKRSRLRSLREVSSRFEGVGAGVRALMTKLGPEEQRRQKGVVGLVADRIDCPPVLTGALAGALGDSLQHVVVSGLEAGVGALDFLRQQAKGRATLVPRHPRRTVGARRPLPEVDGIVGRLADLVRSAPEDETLVRHLTGDFVVVTDLEAALRVHRSGQVEETLVTLDGERLATDGTLTGGRGDESGAHMIEMKREMRELEGVVAELEGELQRAVEEHGELRRRIAALQAEIDGARNAAHESEIAIVKAEKDLRRAEEDAVQASKRAERLGEELQALSAQLTEADEEESEARAEIAASKASFEEASRELSSAQAVYQERQRSVEEQSARVTEVRVRAAQARERAESDRGALERLGRSIQDLDAREGRLRGDVATGAAEQGRIAAEMLLARGDLHERVGEAMTAHEVLGGARALYESARHGLQEGEGGLRELRRRIDEISGRVGELTLRDRELSMELEHLMEQIDERHRLDLRTVLIDYHSRELPSPEIRERVGELLRLIERMGPINLTAIEEYEEKSQRFTYLKGQKDDLEDALRKLDKAIREMNRESKRMFKEAFVAVNERFKRIFPELFRGGSAELRLTDPNDILESGIDIIAQPPGKKLGSLELMSGGEKALTAVAMIFAIFQYKPSPFCLLDEVDAPLDEANISRFAQAIRQMTDRSQFIVITHSKRTMEYTDVLYGVTMEEPGISKTVAVELRGDKRPVPGTERVAVA